VSDNKDKVLQVLKKGKSLRDGLDGAGTSLSKGLFAAERLLNRAGDEKSKSDRPNLVLLLTADGTNTMDSAKTTLEVADRLKARGNGVRIASFVVNDKNPRDTTVPKALQAVVSAPASENLFVAKGAHLLSAQRLMQRVCPKLAEVGKGEKGKKKRSKKLFF